MDDQDSLRDVAYARFEAQRDEWLQANAPNLIGMDPVHQCAIAVPSRQGDIEFCEITAGGAVCAGYTAGGRVAFGTATEVLCALTSRPGSDPWVKALLRALDRERAWTASRRSLLDVDMSDGEMFHVTASRNRASIQRHGLDWDQMGAACGIAGSTGPELAAVFLSEDEYDASFFSRMSRLPCDMWAVRVDGIWTEPGPDGWRIAPERIPSNRLRLVKADIPVYEGPRPFSFPGRSGYESGFRITFDPRL